MIRSWLAVLMAIALAACSKAPQDLIAHYAVNGSADGLVIKAARNGDLRIESPAQLLIRHGGTDYFIGEDKLGRYAVRTSDLLAEARRRAATHATSPAAQPDFVLNEGGKETVAGIDGKQWTLTASGANAPPPLDGVVSDDASLKSIGEALRVRLALSDAGATAEDGYESNQRKQIAALFAKGAVLRLGDIYRLDRVERAPVAASDFELPATILDLNGLKARTRQLVAGAP